MGRSWTWRRRLGITLVLAVAVLMRGGLVPLAVHAQASLPPTCTTGDVHIENGFSWACVSPNVWVAAATWPGAAVYPMAIYTSLPAGCAGSQIAVLTTYGVTTNRIPGPYVCENGLWRNITAFLLKTINNIQDNVYTDVLTVTVPNLSVSAAVEVSLLSALGAGGAVGANEAMGSSDVEITLTRVMGLSVVAQVKTLSTSTDAREPGATTIASTVQLSAVSGAASGTQTFTLQYRINSGSGASNNHMASVRANVYRTLGGTGVWIQ